MWDEYEDYQYFISPVIVSSIYFCLLDFLRLLESAKLRWHLYLFLPGAYELSSTYERIQGGPARGARQEELGAELARKLRERMKTEMRAAGWQVVTHTREGQEIWQYKPKPARLTSAQNVTTTQVTVTRTARNVSFTCRVCGKDTTQLRMPGPHPRYCSGSCAKEGERAKTRARVGRLRERQKNREEKGWS